MNLLLLFTEYLLTCSKVSYNSTIYRRCVKMKLIYVVSLKRKILNTCYNCTSFGYGRHTHVIVNLVRFQGFIYIYLERSIMLYGVDECKHSER